MLKGIPLTVKRRRNLERALRLIREDSSRYIEFRHFVYLHEVPAARNSLRYCVVLRHFKGMNM